MIKAVLFDADGVLINGEMFSKQLEREYGITTEMTKPFFTQAHIDCVLGKATLRDVLPPYLEQWGWEKSIDEFINYWFTSEHHIDEKLADYIQELRRLGIICALATNQSKDRFDYMLTEMGFNQLFDKVYGSAYLGYQKPDKEFFAKVFADIGIANKEEVLFWDDSARKVAGAKRFGIMAEVYTTFAEFKEKMDEILREAQDDKK